MQTGGTGTGAEAVGYYGSSGKSKGAAQMTQRKQVGWVGDGRRGQRPTDGPQ